MPHSSRRPRKPYHPKRIISESEDGWSRVERTTPSRYGSTPTVDSSLPPVDRSLTVQKLLDEHIRCKKQWVKSEARQWLQQLLARQMAERGWSLNKAVCVALGSPSLSWANRLRSVWQLVMFMDVVDMGMTSTYITFPQVADTVSAIKTQPHRRAQALCSRAALYFPGQRVFTIPRYHRFEPTTSRRTGRRVDLHLHTLHRVASRAAFYAGCCQVTALCQLVHALDRR